MTPKEKASELIIKYFKLLPISASFEYSINICKQCALIAVDEIIKDRERLEDAFFYDGNYWNKVKKEIQKL